MNLMISKTTYRKRYYKDPMSKDQMPINTGVRLHSHDPETACIQIRGEKEYAYAYLSLSQIEALIEGLEMERDRLRGKVEA